MDGASKRNGELLRLMVAADFDALLTVDQRRPFQQNLQFADVGVLEVHCRTNRVGELRPLEPLIPDALARLTPGAVISVGN
jgi:hypothetical protein